MAVKNNHKLKVKGSLASTIEGPSGEALLQLEAVFRAFPDFLFKMDRDGKVLDYKAGNKSILFLPPEEFIGKRMQDVIPAEAGKKFSQAIEQAILTGKVIPINYQLNVPEGVHWFEARLIAVADSQVIAIVRDVTEHVQISERAQRQFQHLSALQSIDATITASFDLNVTLSVILRQVTSQLGVDAADVLLLDQNTHMLNFAAGQGLRASGLQHTPVLVGQGYAGLAALNRRTISIPNLSNQRPDLMHSTSFLQEGFSCYYAVPLIVKGQVKGVLEIYNQAPLKPGEEWLEFLATLAGEAAIAIDSASLFQDLQRTNTELTMAYDAAIEGWAQLLELSGRETKDHTQNVARMAVELARMMGISDKDLVHIRRGAFLHDVGKLGISEHILQKSGPLTEDEWIVIRQHPQLAYQLLVPLNYLAPALDIPHYHHERWDGSGYPYGLVGEQIPIAARIFAVIDVYDSLTSSRPYRSAMSQQDALDHIRHLAEIHFDPAVVTVFLRKMGMPD